MQGRVTPMPVKLRLIHPPLFVACGGTRAMAVITQILVTFFLISTTTHFYYEKHHLVLVVSL
jgi:hypothetical protein